VKVVLQEAYYPAKNSELIAKQSGAQLLKLAGATNFKGGESYVAHIGAIVKQVTKVYPK